MSQVFPHHNLILKTNYFINWFFKSNYTCLRSSPTYFDLKKNSWYSNWFFFKIKIRWGKTWYMRKHAFQGLKRMFIHVSGLPPPYFDKKTKYFINWFFLSKYGWGRSETSINVRFRPWKAGSCMSQVFPHHILMKKKFYKLIGFLSKYVGGRHETCINVRFRLWNARLCMSQVFPHHFLIKNQFTN